MCILFWMPSALEEGKKKIVGTCILIRSTSIWFLFWHFLLGCALPQLTLLPSLSLGMFLF